MHGAICYQYFKDGDTEMNIYISNKIRFMQCSYFMPILIYFAGLTVTLNSCMHIKMVEPVNNLIHTCSHGDTCIHTHKHVHTQTHSCMHSCTQYICSSSLICRS